MATSLVNNKYRITRRIGGGSFGEIYMGIGPSGEKVAVKFERHGTRCPQLRHEYKVCRELANCHGFCSVYHFGTQDDYNVMVMDLLGPSLEDLFNKCQRRFSLKTVLQLADQMLERVDTLHSRHLIHRDIKPANFVIGIGDQGANVYCVDFGLSKRYRHPKSLQHIPHRDGRSLTGTPRYASINNHLGIEQSRRDDLESVGYVLIYFLKGSLPWQGLKAKNAQKKYRMIMEKKQQVSIAQLCQGCPSQFAEFLASTRSLKFDAKPDIPYLRKLFRDLYHAQGCASVGKLWDWDHIDTDYMTTGVDSGSVTGPSASGPAPLGANPRPTTAAAVAGAGMGDAMVAGDGDMAASDGMRDDEYGRGMSAKPQDRPGTVGASLPAAGSKPTQQSAQGANGQWGFSRQSGQESGAPLGGGPTTSMLKDPRSGSSAGVPSDYIMSAGIADPSQKRPHTAHGGRAAGQPSASAADLRKPSSGAAPMDQDEEGDAHVVAGARAMMRYRRTRASSGEGPDVPTGPGPAQLQNPQQGLAGSGRATWTGAGPDPAQGSAAPRTIYQNPAAKGSVATSGAGPGVGYQANKQPQQPQQQYLLQRDKATGAAQGQQSAAGAGSGWIGSSGAQTSDRPKSAGLMSSLTSGAGSAAASAPRAATVGGAAAQSASSAGGASNPQAAAQGANNTLSYGSLKNRFLSGGSTSKTATTKSSKLFSLSR